MAAAGAPVVDVNFADPEVLQDPYPLYHAIRDAGPAVFNPSARAWMVASYEHVREVMLDDKRFVPEAEKWETLYGAPVVESMEDPRHRDVRGIYAPAFRPSALREMRENFIHGLVVEHIDAVAEQLGDGDVVDILTAVSQPVAGRVLGHLIGVSEEDVPKFLQWAQDMGSTLESYDEPDPGRAARLRKRGTSATAATCAYAGAQLEDRRHHPHKEDLIGRIVRSPVRQTMTEAEQRSGIAQVIVAGHDNITNTLGNIFVVLASFPDQRQMIDADRSLVPRAIEEILRWSTSASGDTRLVRGEATIGNVAVSDGDRVVVLLAAANRDPARWRNPDEFDVAREPQPHLSFGTGTHTCLGANLARVEAALMMNEVLDRLPPFRLADERIEYGPPFFMRGPKAVRITV